MDNDKTSSVDVNDHFKWRGEKAAVHQQSIVLKNHWRERRGWKIFPSVHWNEVKRISLIYWTSRSLLFRCRREGRGNTSESHKWMLKSELQSIFKVCYSQWEARVRRIFPFYRFHVFFQVEAIVYVSTKQLGTFFFLFNELQQVLCELLLSITTLFTSLHSDLLISKLAAEMSMMSWSIQQGNVIFLSNRDLGSPLLAFRNSWPGIGMQIQRKRLQRVYTFHKRKRKAAMLLRKFCWKFDRSIRKRELKRKEDVVYTFLS